MIFTIFIYVICIKRGVAMNSNVLAYLENSAERFPEKCAVTDESVSYTYSELVKLSSSVYSGCIVQIGTAREYSPAWVSDISK